MNDDYYSYQPTVTLARPLVLCGFVCAPVSDLGSLLAQRTGLPYIELERWMEHELGEGLAPAVERQGWPAVRGVERRLLDRALDDRPPAVIALPDGALLDPQSLARVKREADLVYVEAPADWLLERIRAWWNLAPGALALWPVEPPRTVEEVWQQLGPRVDGYREAGLWLDGTGSVSRLSAHVKERIQARRLRERA